MHGFVTWLMAASLLLLVIATWQQDGLPDHALLLPELQQAPVQQDTRRVPFDKSAGGITYHLQPRYAYELRGLVVSRHDADSWLDYLHAKWNDKLNVADLCVIWGPNLDADTYRYIADDFSFSSGQFTCNFSTRSREAFTAFDQEAISNNHLLAAAPELVERIRGVRVGDQVHLRGLLAEYSHDESGGFHRGTSTVRSDRGNGACETIYVESFDLLSAGPSGWRMVKWFAAILLVLGAVGWILLPVRVRHN